MIIKPYNNSNNRDMIHRWSSPIQPIFASTKEIFKANSKRIWCDYNARINNFFFNFAFIQCLGNVSNLFLMKFHPFNDHHHHLQKSIVIVKWKKKQKCLISVFICHLNNNKMLLQVLYDKKCFSITHKGLSCFEKKINVCIVNVALLLCV